jgi:hypothetical protein
VLLEVRGWLFKVGVEHDGDIENKRPPLSIPLLITSQLSDSKLYSKSRNKLTGIKGHCASWHRTAVLCRLNSITTTQAKRPVL